MASFSQETASGAANFFKLLEIQPLQNLAKNFDVDVASCLDELLQELQDIHDGDGETQYDAETLNFAHAALAVQNSTYIYSRKVDHLYALATATAEEIVADDGKRKHRENLDKDLEGMDSFFELHQDPDFLLLDDIPTDAKKDMDLKSSRMSLSTRYSLSSRTSLSDINWSKDSIETSRYEDQLRKNRMSSSVREIVRGSGGDFFSSSRISVGGCLHLPGSGPVFEDATKPLQIDDSINDQLIDNDQDFACDDGGYDDDKDDGVAFDFGHDSESHDVHNHSSAKQHQTRKHVSFAVSTEQLEQQEDPYEQLDPYTETMKKRKLRIGKTIVLPPTITMLPSESVTGARTRKIASTKSELPIPRTQNVRSLAAETFHAALEVRKRTHEALCRDESIPDSFDATLPAIPLKGFYFGSEFAYIAKAAMKRRAAELRELRKEQGVQTKRDAPTSLRVSGNDYDEDDGGPTGFDFGGDDNDECNDFGPANDVPCESNTGLASLDDVFARRTTDESGGVNTDGSPQTFEELCRIHLGNLKEKNEKYLNRSKLAKRVNEWQERMSKTLADEMERPAFDIQAYGRNVISLAEKECHHSSKADGDDYLGIESHQTINFREMVRHQPQHEICRMFLATLSLCCSGNIEVVENAGGDGSSLAIKLLNKKIETPMEQYVAPSELETRS